MPVLDILLPGYSDIETLSVYVNNELLRVEPDFSCTEYKCELPAGTHQVKIVKHAGMLDKHWKRDVVLNWISLFLESPDTTPGELRRNATSSIISFDVDLTYKMVKIKLKLRFTGFEIVEGEELCKNIEKENYVYQDALKRVKRYYLIPFVVLVVFILFLILVVTFFDRPASPE